MLWTLLASKFCSNTDSTFTDAVFYRWHLEFPDNQLTFTPSLVTSGTHSGIWDVISARWSNRKNGGSYKSNSRSNQLNYPIWGSMLANTLHWRWPRRGKWLVLLLDPLIETCRDNENSESVWIPSGRSRHTFSSPSLSSVNFITKSRYWRQIRVGSNSIKGSSVLHQCVLPRCLG